MRKYQAGLAGYLLSLLITLHTQAQGKVQPQAPPQPRPGPTANEAPKSAGSSPIEPYIFETLQSKIRFESDGSGSRDLVARVRIQSDSALRDFGLLVFPYQQSSETLDIVYVRVRKNDGTVTFTPGTDIQDLDSEVSRAAPMYTDRREKHVAVRSLAVGDILEYDARWVIVHPIAPGNFWYTYNFFRQGIVQDERLEINVPKDRPVKLSDSFAPVIKDDGGRRIYSYRNSHLERDPEDAESPWEKLLRPTPLPDIQLSSFASWDEVGKWYDALQKPQLRVTPEIQAKATELTRGGGTDLQKLHAIYDFVSTRFRYISISLGAGRYAPHPANEVLANQYGDCKDKHTLFAALLEASGIKSYPVLISSIYQPDSAVPSPALFNHVITAVPQGDSTLFLDTTPEVAPFGLLSFPIRGKLALVIPEHGSAQLLKTPADPIFPSTQKFEMVASIDEKGTLDGRARLETRGDTELAQRQAFLATAQTQWQQLTQSISASMGFAGTVSDVSVAQPDATTNPFWLSYSYHRPEFPDWANQRIALALPFMGLPSLTDKEVSSKNSLPLGPIEEITFTTKITLPKGYVPEIPPTVEIKRNFAEYTAEYSFQNDILLGTRKLVTHLREVPAAGRPAYVSFVKAVQEDEGRFIPVSGGSAAATAQSINPQAQRLYNEARESLQLGAPRAATSTLERAVKLAPDWSNAWLLLGSAHMMARQSDAAIEAFHQAVFLDPANPQGYRALAIALTSSHKDVEAVRAWRSLLKLNPDDRMASAALTSLLLSTENYSEARPILEKAVEQNPKNPTLCLQLGQTLLHLGEEENSLSQFHKALELDSTSNMLNSVAYALAEAKTRLTDALHYAEQAVQETEAQTADIRPDSKDHRGDFLMADLAAQWDTLGWVKFRLGDFVAAARYLESAWSLMPATVISEHLDQARAKLGGKFRVAADTSDLRTYPIRQIKDWGGGYKSAEFLIDLAKGPEVKGAWFVSGAEELEDSSNALSSLKYKVSFPDDGPTHIIRRGILSCSQVSKGCIFVLYPVEPARPKPFSFQ